MNTKFNTKFFSLALIASVLVFAGGCSLFGIGSINSSTAAVSKTSDGLALEGYDAVAYFKENLPREGKAEFTTDYNGAKWQFQSAENRDAFIKEPAKYAPQYGGFEKWTELEFPFEESFTVTSPKEIGFV